MACEKISYSSREAAINSIQGIKKDKRAHASKRKPVRAYRCSECDGWHISSNTRHKIKKVVNSLKQLKTSEPFVRGRLIIKDFTFRLFNINDNMARFVGLLYTGVILFTVSAFGYDSEVDKVYDTSGVTLSVGYSDYDYHTVSLSMLDVEVPAEFVIYHPSLGHGLTMCNLAKVKALNGYHKVPRGPPDSCSQKSA